MSTWIPGLIVVALGLTFGLLIVLRAKPERNPAGESTDPDVHPPSVRSKAAAPERRSALLGFLGGIGTCLVVGGLVFWATRGARPEPSSDPTGVSPAARTGPRTGSASPAPMGALASSEAAVAHDESAALTPERAAQLARLRDRVATAPQELNARREFTVALLHADQLMEAFEQARELQRLSPDDPDGLYVEGVVRLAMGQWPDVISMMDRVLAQHPDHVLALLAKGQAELAIGQRSSAIETWRRGLDAAGGRFPPIEERLAEAEQIEGSAPSGAAKGTAAAPASSAVAAGAYRVRIELDPAAVVPRGPDGGPPTLFVVLWGGAPGPPVAVKRVANPAFPLDLQLSLDDSMMGQPLPAQGRLTVRLESDGNASTKEAGDLESSVNGISGTQISVALRRGGA